MGDITAKPRLFIDKFPRAHREQHFTYARISPCPPVCPGVPGPLQVPSTGGEHQGCPQVKWAFHWLESGADRGLDMGTEAEISPGAAEGMEVGRQADFHYRRRLLIDGKGGVDFFFLTVVKQI